MDTGVMYPGVYFDVIVYNVFPSHVMMISSILCLPPPTPTQTAWI